MAENNHCGSNANEDVDDLLKQLRKTFTAQRAEISDLKNSLRIAEAEGKHLRMECHKWKSKCDSITKLCIAHNELLAPLLEPNADTSDRLSEDSFEGSSNMLVDQGLASPKPVPQKVDDSFQVSVSFESTENLAQRRNEDGNMIDESYDESNEQSETSGQGNNVSCKESEVDVVRRVDNEVVSSNESSNMTDEQYDDTVYKSDSINQTLTILTDNVDLTIMNDDSDEEHRKGPQEEKKLAFAGFNEDDLCMRKTATYLKTHSVIRPFKCHLCAATCSTSRNLKNHVKTHADEKLFQCNKCQKRFLRRILLNKHFLTHTGDEKPFQCNVCEKRFSQQSYLSRHSITHTGGGAKSFQCNRCQKWFSQKSYLESHIRRVHADGENSFQCTVCQKRFSQKSHLKMHLSRTHTVKTFQCHLCKSSFQSKRNVKRHTNNRICKIVAKTLTNANRRIDKATVDNTERETIGFEMDQPHYQIE